MTGKRALGKGVDALFPDLDVEKQGEKQVLEVKSSKLEDPSSKLEDLSSKVEDLSYDPSAMQEAIKEAKRNPRVTTWSPISTTVLKYLRKTQPEFSISEEVNSLLEESIARKYPDLYESVKNGWGKD